MSRSHGICQSPPHAASPTGTSAAAGGFGCRAEAALLTCAAMMLRALCFDYGGTLDGPGSHWLPRFARLYAEQGLELPFERLRDAFDHATRGGYADARVARMDLHGLAVFHVGRQLERLGVDEPGLAARVVERFVDEARAALADSRAVLDRLRHRFRLGVISNFYGNVERILADAGLAAWMSVIVDSNRVGVSKPDPRIFSLALEGLGCAPHEAMYVGDSFEKDVVAAHAAGWRTAWVVGRQAPPCPNTAIVDVTVRTLTDLENFQDRHDLRDPRDREDQR